MNGQKKNNQSHGPSIIYIYINLTLVKHAARTGSRNQPCPTWRYSDLLPSHSVKVASGSYPGSWPVRMCRNHPSRNDSIQK